MNALPLIAVGLGAYLLYQGKRSAESLKYMMVTPSGVKPDLSNLLAPKFKISLDLFNPNNVDIPVQLVYGIIRDNSGKKLASFTSNAAFTVVHDSSSTINLVLVINGLNIIALLVSAFQKKQVYNFVLEGVVKTMLFEQKFSQSIIIG